MSQTQIKGGTWIAVAALLVSIFCFQIGASMAKQLFPKVGAEGTVALRVGLSAVMMLVIGRPWYFSLLPGLVCLAANQWPVLYSSAQFHNIEAILGIAACLIAPLLGLLLLRHAKGIQPPPMRRWAYALYPAHFLLLLAIRQVIT